MKKLLILSMAIAVVLLSACKKEQFATVSANITAPVLITPTASTAIVVNAADTTQTLNIKWSKADYGVDAVLSYFVQIDADGGSFKKGVSLGTTSADNLSLTYGALNNKIMGELGLAANAVTAVQIRVGAAISGKDSAFSKPVKLSVATFKELAPTKLYVPGAYQNWTPATALAIPAVTTYTYEGYVYMNTADYFKFTSSPDWDHVNYGDSGTQGKLTTDGLAGGLKVNAAGYYKLNADIKALTYSATLIKSFGIIGTATPHAWDASTAMTYDQGKNVWTVKVDLVAGALKFRANDAWDVNYGPADSNALSGNLIQTDGAITIPSAGNYTVTIDMSQSGGKKYLYTVVKN